MTERLRFLQLRISQALPAFGMAAALCSCDEAPPKKQPPSPATASSISPSTPTERPTQNKLPVIPEDENALAAFILRLMESPRHDAAYAEQVKAATALYLKRYTTNSKHRQLAMECFIRALLHRPERFSGRDFDRAYEFCDYPAEYPPPPLLQLYRLDLELSDYRKALADKKQVMDKLDALLPDADAATLAHALTIAAKHAQGERRKHYINTFFNSAAAKAAYPYLLQMLSMGALSAQQRATAILNAATQGCEAAHLLPYLAALPPEIASAALETAPAGKKLLFLNKAEKRLAQPDIPPEEIEQTIAQLREDDSDYAALLTARYLQKQGNIAEAVATARPLTCLETETPCRIPAAFLLAELLAQQPDSAPEAETLYRQLAQEPDSPTVQQALAALIKLQEQQQQYKAAFLTCAELLQMPQAPQSRARILIHRAELAEIIGNLTEAINLYSQLETEYCGTPEIALPACRKLLQLLSTRNLPPRTDHKKATFTPSDKWYAWVRGRDFVKGWQQNPELLQSLSPDQKAIFDEICRLVNALSIDYDVLTEERDRKR